jgi:DNA-binding NtrC family response regulator
MKKSILIVDDDKYTCENMVKVLSKSYMTFTACNGREALKILSKEDSIALVLTDMMMPVMDGMKLLEAIRATDRYTEVIMISGDRAYDLACNAMRSGAYAFIEKPISLNMLKSTIIDALQKKTL